MREEVLKERKEKLTKGLASLEQKSNELLMMIDVQKGALTEVDFWLKELDKETVVQEPSAEAEENKEEK